MKSSNGGEASKEDDGKTITADRRSELLNMVQDALNKKEQEKNN
jgi:hypothetical protein